MGYIGSRLPTNHKFAAKKELYLMDDDDHVLWIVNGPAFRFPHAVPLILWENKALFFVIFWI